MKAGVVASLFAAASAAELDITWSDCGAKHAKTTNVQPAKLPLGEETEIIGSGTVDEDVTGGTYDTELTAGGGLIDSHFTGNNCEAKTFDLPLGIGSLTWEGVTCPLSAGDADIKFKVKLASSLPASIATSDINLKAQDQNGEDLLCVKLHLEKAKTSLAEIAEEVNAKKAGWTAAAPANFADVEEVKAYLGAHLPGDAEYVSVGPEKKEYSAVELPASFDSAEQWPQCTVISNVRDQSSCGSCWAFGSVSSFEARACIATGKDVKYSPEQTAFCFNYDGCGGGNNVWRDFESEGVVSGGDYTDEQGATCSRYSLKPCAHHVPADEKYQPCPSSEYPSPSCPSSCEDGYSKSFSADKLRAATVYSNRGEENMMKDLVENGPMYVSFTVYSDFPTYKSGVYKHTTSQFLGGHAVTLVGYGELDGQKYWKIKNSWNENWGNNGHFLIARGSNECGIEGDAGAGTISATTVV